MPYLLPLVLFFTNSYKNPVYIISPSNLFLLPLSFIFHRLVRNYIDERNTNTFRLYHTEVVQGRSPFTYFENLAYSVHCQCLVVLYVSPVHEEIGKHSNYAGERVPLFWKASYLNERSKIFSRRYSTSFLPVSEISPVIAYILTNILA